MRLMILCEGETEKTVLRGFLAPFCTGFDKVEVINPGGNAKLLGEFKSLAETAIEANSNTIVFCLIDVYAAPFNYPKSVHASVNPHLAQYSYIKQYMEEKIESQFRQQFYAFPVMMEIETWLLADMEGLNGYFKPPAEVRLQTIDKPESITQPAKEIEKIWRRFKNREYSKNRHGKKLFDHVQAQRVYDDNCPHFEAIINELLKLQGISVSQEEPLFEIPNAELYEKLTQLQKQHDELLEKYIETDDEKLHTKILEIEAGMEQLNKEINTYHNSAG